MAISDTEYVKAPSLRAGDLSIEKSSTGFSMSEGDTVFLTGSADGTLTIGKENLASSIPTLHINAKSVYWNNKPLKDYWAEGGSGTGVSDLTQDVTELQELTAANTQAIQATDERLSQELSDLRLDALGAKINILTNPINTYPPGICGVAVPATLLKEALPYFNKITLNNVQNSGTGYLAIYSCDATTPAVSSPCTLLYVVEEAFETTGSPGISSTSSTINIPDKITVPDSGLIILIFSSSATAPQADNISWITGENSTIYISVGTYSPGATNRPYDTNGVYVLQKGINAAFLTYSPDIDFSYVYDETESILSEDIEDIKSQIEDLRSDIEDLGSAVENLQSDYGNYMTYDETVEAIAAFPYDGIADRTYDNLGTLVDVLTIPTNPFVLVKEGYDKKSSIELNEASFGLSTSDHRQNNYSVITELTLRAETAQLAVSNLNLDSGSSEYTAITELKLESGIAYLATRQDTGESVDLTSLSMRNTGSPGSEAGIIDLKSICKSKVTGTAAQSTTYLTAGLGKLEMGVQDNGQDLFQLSAKYQDSLYTDANYVSGVKMLAKSRTNSDNYIEMCLEPPELRLNSYSSLGGIDSKTYLRTYRDSLSLGIQNNGQNVFELYASSTQVHLTSTSDQNSTIYSDLHMTPGACDIRSYYNSILTGTLAQASTYLTTGSGTVAMGIRDNGLDLFELSASIDGARLKSTKYNDSAVCSEMDIDPSGINFLSVNSNNSANRLNKLSLTIDGLAFSTNNASIWNTKLGTSSKFVPTISIVHYLIQQALANQ